MPEIDYDSPAGQVRLLIADVDPDRPVLTDQQVQAFLAYHGVKPADMAPSAWSVKRAAASALATIATSEVMIGKVIRTQDLQTDGAKVAAELRAQAAALRAQADADEDKAADEDSDGILISEFVPYPPMRRWG